MAPKLDIYEIAKKIEWGIDKWPGNCYAISCRIVDERIIKGKAVYGHYYGPINQNNKCFNELRPFQRHGWIRTEKNIVDFTRWVFEEKTPYIYSAPFNEEYDEGGNRFRKICRNPVPIFDITEKQIDLKLNNHTRYFVLDNLLGGSPRITLRQAVWIANLDLQTLDKYAPKIYSALKSANLKAAIPIDNWIAVMEKEKK